MENVGLGSGGSEMTDPKTPVDYTPVGAGYAGNVKEVGPAPTGGGQSYGEQA
jgi:hypothetical protein